MSLFYTNETNTLKNHKEKVGDIMTSLKSANRRVGSLFAVAALVLATVTPGLVPAFASAAQLSERSVALSSSSAGMDGVSYDVGFTTEDDFSAVVLDFCNDTPLIGAACSAPAGFSVTGATTPTSNYSVYTTGAADDANTIVLANSGTVTAGATDVQIAGVSNPDNAGPLYVRIVTYDTNTNAGAYVSNAQPGTGSIDQGSAAASITDTVGVSGAVLETMTFCVAGNVINLENCTTTDNGGVLTAPTVQLGEGTGVNRALTSGALSEGSIFSQISTNAAGGAVVNLKSSALSCGGLVRAGAPSSCDIAPALAAGFSQGEAKFGVQVAGATDPTGETAGTYRAYSDTPYYSDSVFKLNYIVGNATGITSPYGDPLLDTDDAPVSNKNVEITFGASVSNQTPAGLYSTDLSLIATGKF